MFDQDIKKVLSDLQLELEYAKQKWGISFDDKNTINDWGAYIALYLGRAMDACSSKAEIDLTEARKQLLKVASVAINAVVSLDRNQDFPKRHYD